MLLAGFGSPCRTQRAQLAPRRMDGCPLPYPHVFSYFRVVVPSFAPSSFTKRPISGSTSQDSPSRQTPKGRGIHLVEKFRCRNTNCHKNPPLIRLYPHGIPEKAKAALTGQLPQLSLFTLTCFCLPLPTLHLNHSLGLMGHRIENIFHHFALLVNSDRCAVGIAPAFMMEASVYPGVTTIAPQWYMVV